MRTDSHGILTELEGNDARLEDCKGSVSICEDGSGQCTGD